MYKTLYNWWTPDYWTINSMTTTWNRKTNGQAPKMLVNFASFRSVFDSTMEAFQFSEVLKTQARQQRWEERKEDSWRIFVFFGYVKVNSTGQVGVFFLDMCFWYSPISLYSGEVSHFFRVENVWCSKLHFAMDIKQDSHFGAVCASILVFQFLCHCHFGILDFKTSWRQLLFQPWLSYCIGWQFFTNFFAPTLPETNTAP